MTVEKTGAGFRWTLSVLDVPDGGLAIDRSLEAADRAALARQLDILEVKAARLKGRLRAAGAGAYRLEGQITADVAQACVVTLDPVPERVVIALAIDFVPELHAPPIPEVATDEDLEDETPLSEPIVNGEIDLGEIVFQEIAAALDPFPRLADATLDQTEAAPKASEDAHPFAKLRALQSPKPPKDGA